MKERLEIWALNSLMAKHPTVNSDDFFEESESGELLIAKEYREEYENILKILIG